MTSGMEGRARALPKTGEELDEPWDWTASWRGQAGSAGLPAFPKAGGPAASWQRVSPTGARLEKGGWTGERAPYAAARGRKEGALRQRRQP